ncbi:hypothetical protein GsuE55_11940 [Geobacillus subterraneus]|uniref:Uncharacterized protein n=1 Tax=Geobacillus subterraneus TaxID=129338 RepID=A0A679FXB8_9BACL|nr:hypothetical protein B4113_2194 [Geobacillus sp. B4113_201601]BBW96361.1 hypothetical protein GsuE55_11940 [Geobacillus subterraneus]
MGDGREADRAAKERYTFMASGWKIINGVPYNMTPAPSFVHQYFKGIIESEGSQCG